MTTQVTSSVRTVAPDEAAIEEFIASVRGPVVRPGDPEYDELRAVQNGLIDRRPALIVRCSGAADVINAVNFGRDSNLEISVRGGGHNVAGNAVCDGGLTIDLSLMRAVHVDPIARTALVQGGATWAEVDRETQVFGLATPGGAVSTTGVGGLTLHGGMGHLRRKHGLSLDNLISVNIVTADGMLRRASESENSDLFWAVRGAGSNYGVVTSFEFRLHPVGPQVALCAVLYDVADAPAVLPKWRTFVESAPDEISALALFWSVPPGFPDELVGRPVLIVAAVHSGPAEEGERAMQPLRELATPLLDMSHPTAYTDLQSSFDPFFPKGLLYYWKAVYLEHLDDAAIGELCRIAAERPSSMSDITLWHHGGAMSRVDPEATAFGDRQAQFMASIEASWPDAANRDQNIAWARDGWAAMRQYSAGGVYLNFPGFGEEKEDLLRSAYGSNYDRLVALKQIYDPENLFHLNQNIRPDGY